MKRRLYWLFSVSNSEIYIWCYLTSLFMFHHTSKVETFGKIIGILFGYLVFSSILFLVLRTLNKIPDTWNYLHIAIPLLFLIGFGEGIRRLLK